MSSVPTVLAVSPMGRLAQRDLTGGQVCTVAAASAAAMATVSIGLTSDLGAFFGCCFVLVSLTAALAASVKSLYVPGVLPPLLLVVVLFGVASLAPEAIDAPGLAETAGTTQRAIAGIVQHATALVLGHVLALATIAYRIATAKRPVGGL